MRSRGLVVLPMLLALAAACAEGGGRGSGIFSALQGNVSSVQAASADPNLQGITVAIEGTQIQTQTDAHGEFALHGDFEGILTVRFRPPASTEVARIELNVPAGGTLTMSNVTVDAAQGEATAETLGVDFDGIIVGIDCPGLTLTLVSSQESRADVDLYTLRLDTSSVQDSHGNAVSCREIRVGEQAMIQGTVNPDGSFGQATVVLQD